MIMIEGAQITKAYVLIAVSLEFVSISEALEGTQLDEKSLADKERIALSEAVQVVNNINIQSKVAHWPVLLGKHLGIASHGPVGYASVCAPTIGKALQTFVEWFRIRCDCYTSKIEERDETFDIFVYDISGDSVFKSFFFQSFSRACEVLIGQLNGHFKKGETAINFEMPCDRALLTHFQNEYQSTLKFDAQQNKLTIPKSIWYLRSPLFDSDSHALNLEKCQQISDSLQQTKHIDIAIKTIIKNRIENRILNAGDEQAFPTLSNLSDVLHQSERTIVRKLQKRNTSFTRILEDQRVYFADKLLRDARYSIADISDILGYSEAASFCRAFKTWHGMQPSTYRRRPTMQ